MHNVYKLNDSIYWIGANDRRISLFENHFPLSEGVSYNSYFIDGEETAVMDTADDAVLTQYFENLAYVLNGRALNYIIVQHMEPDHCAGLAMLAEKHPEAKIVVNCKTAAFIKQMFPLADKLSERFVTVCDGQSLQVGDTALTFCMAPMVHWPEVMVTYDSTHKILFSADAFGSFGALNGNIVNDKCDMKAKLSEYRRYYTNIVGKYGMQAAKLLGKASGLDIRMICPLHGLVLVQDFDFILDKYTKWASYTPEDKAIMIAFASMYHHTENAAEILACALDRRGVRDIVMYDVSRTDVSYLVAEAFRCSHIVLAAPTYMNELYPEMANFIRSLQSHALRDRKTAVIGNGTWANQANKTMISMLEGMKNTEVLGSLEFMSAPGPDKVKELEELAETIAASLR
ncbi:FprA family A-type flavoprotein [bacterium]|nr:FprA family A-type flavoprotein [bacterium]